MADKILLSFKDTELEQKLLKYIQEQGKLIGTSSFIKQLVYQDMIKNKPEERTN